MKNLQYLISGSKDNKHELGVGFYVRNSMLEYIEDFKINERVCYPKKKAGGLIAH